MSCWSAREISSSKEKTLKPKVHSSQASISIYTVRKSSTAALKLENYSENYKNSTIRCGTKQECVKVCLSMLLSTLFLNL